MARRKGRPRGLAPARNEGPDRKSLVKYVDIRLGLLRVSTPFSSSRFIQSVLVVSSFTGWSLCLPSCSRQTTHTKHAAQTRPSHIVTRLLADEPPFPAHLPHAHALGKGAGGGFINYNRKNQVAPCFSPSLFKLWRATAGC